MLFILHHSLLPQLCLVNFPEFPKYFFPNRNPSAVSSEIDGVIFRMDGNGRVVTIAIFHRRVQRRVINTFIADKYSSPKPALLTKSAILTKCVFRELAIDTLSPKGSPFNI